MNFSTTVRAECLGPQTSSVSAESVAMSGALADKTPAELSPSASQCTEGNTGYQISSVERFGSYEDALRPAGLSGFSPSNLSPSFLCSTPTHSEWPQRASSRESSELKNDFCGLSFAECALAPGGPQHPATFATQSSFAEHPASVATNLSQTLGFSVEESTPNKRKADDMSLDETDLLVAEILSSGWGRGGPSASKPNNGQPRSGTKAIASKRSCSSASSAAGSPRSTTSSEIFSEMECVSHKWRSRELNANSASRAVRRPTSLVPVAATPAPNWAVKIVEFLQEHGQDLLHAICAHYRIDYTGDLQSIRDYSMEQLAHNALFNPALPKASGRLPKMLRDMQGVNNFQMTFLKDSSKIYRTVRVSATLEGEEVTAECRACSYCGSCFSGRFMKPNAMHQQAGGWKEITEKTAAGKFSWAALKGHRMCVPCFTHFASNGTNVNANRPSIADLIRSEGHALQEDTIVSPKGSSKSLDAVVTPPSEVSKDGDMQWEKSTSGSRRMKRRSNKGGLTNCESYATAARAQLSTGVMA